MQGPIPIKSCSHEKAETMLKVVTKKLTQC